MREEFLRELSLFQIQKRDFLGGRGGVGNGVDGRVA